jgi:hypothetical protein
MTHYLGAEARPSRAIASRRSSDEHLIRLLVIGVGSAASVPLGVRLVG